MIQPTLSHGLLQMLEMLFAKLAVSTKDGFVSP